jgi:uncharacterized RmlC-like cupin family protein
VGTPADRHLEDVTVLSGGLLPGDRAQQFAASSLSEVTHLPTGVASGRSEAVTIPAGTERTGIAGDSSALLLHVTEGRVTVAWGAPERRSVEAGAGDTVLVPAGIAVSASNASLTTDLHLVLLRSG